MDSLNAIGQIHNIYLTFTNFKHHNAFHHHNQILLFHKIRKPLMHGQINLLRPFNSTASSRIVMRVTILLHCYAPMAEYILGAKIMKANWVMEIKIHDLNHA